MYNRVLYLVVEVLYQTLKSTETETSLGMQTEYIVVHFGLAAAGCRFNT